MGHRIVYFKRTLFFNTERKKHIFFCFVNICKTLAPWKQWRGTLPGFLIRGSSLIRGLGAVSPVCSQVPRVAPGQWGCSAVLQLWMASVFA